MVEAIFGRDWNFSVGSPRPLPQSPLVFPALSLAFFFARAPLSERLEQAIFRGAMPPKARG